MEITDQMLHALPFQPVRKTAPVYARMLTLDDYIEKQGVIETLEGRMRFQPGDYLARGICAEEWPIPGKSVTEHYQRVDEPDADGFARYQITNTRHAYQVYEPFTVKTSNGRIVSGKAGDYILQADEEVWIVECSIFEQSYEPLSEDQS